VVLNPGAPQDPHVGITTYDAAGPMGTGDLLNFRRTWTVPSMVPLYNEQTGATQDVPAAGLTLTIICAYIDAPQDGIAAIEIGASPIMLQ
jgi:hypothetical protein